MKYNVLNILCLVSFIGVFLISIKNSFSQTDSSKVFYYSNGSISSQGTLLNGKPHGEWKNYYPDGTLKSVGEWQQGELNGKWLFFSSNGDIQKILYYKNGRKFGLSIEYQQVYIKGIYSVVPKSIEMFENDLRIGKGKYFCTKGCLEKVIPFRNGKFHGRGLLLDSDSNFIEMQYYQMDKLVDFEPINRFDSLGNKVGKWIIFNNNFDISEEENYKNGVRDGWHRIYKSNEDVEFSVLYKDGLIYNNSSPLRFDYFEYIDSSGRIFSGSFFDSIPVGIHYCSDNNNINCKEYNFKGKLIGVGHCSNNILKEGEWSQFNESGVTISTGFFKNGVKQGIWTFFFENGNVEQIGNFINGKEHGLWKWFFSSGKVRKEENYKFGILNGDFFEYDSIGNQLLKGFYLDGLEEGEWIIKIGDIVWKGFYNFGELQGKTYSYFLNGNLCFEGNFFNGTQDGSHRYFSEKGTLIEEQFWSRGEKIGTWKKYSEEGQLLISVTYRNGEEFLINGIKVKY